MIKDARKEVNLYVCCLYNVHPSEFYILAAPHTPALLPKIPCLQPSPNRRLPLLAASQSQAAALADWLKG